MNILYLLGNGFDLAQGLKTRYVDFYPFYTSKTDQGTPAIEKIRRIIKSDYASWSDMELALGEYTSNMTLTEFEEVYYDISDNLREYLKNEQNKFEISEEKVESLMRYFLSPHKFLYGMDRDTVSELLEKEIVAHHIDIVSFNYTNLIDRIFPEPTLIGKIFNKNACIEGIYHIHGTLDGPMSMGVNDVNQVGNQLFKDDDDIKDILIKPQSNEAIRSSEFRKLKKIIDSARLIVFFGLSIGDTDKFWWEEIGNLMYKETSTRLLIYYYDRTQIHVSRLHKLGSKIRKVRNHFLEQTGLSKQKIDSIKDRIYVSFDNQYLSTIDNFA